MLILSKNDGTPIASFENYQELYRHITYKENLKLMEDHLEFGQSSWSFLILSPERIGELIDTLKKDYDETILFEAWRQQLPIIEMCEGDYTNIRQILVTPNINIEGLREDWCLGYCHAYDMSITASESD